MIAQNAVMRSALVKGFAEVRSPGFVRVLFVTAEVEFARERVLLVMAEVEFAWGRVLLAMVEVEFARVLWVMVEVEFECELGRVLLLAISS